MSIAINSDSVHKKKKIKLDEGKKFKHLVSECTIVTINQPLQHI